MTEARDYLAALLVAIDAGEIEATAAEAAYLQGAADTLGRLLGSSPGSSMGVGADE